MRWLALAAAASTLFAACGNRGNAPDAARSHTALLEEGKNALEDGGATHDSLVKISDRLGARATMEGGTASGVLLATTAGELRVRAFRLSGGTLEEDARRASDWL